MENGWQIVAFPLILPWRKEFWTLPLYFADLKVGVIPEWPESMPYKGMPLPPEATGLGEELRHYRPGELRQRQAFREFLESQEAVEDIIKELKGSPKAEVAVELPDIKAWSLVWQLEKMQADEEARMIKVDEGEKWLAEIISPEPWDHRLNFGITGLKEMVDPELAQLRYLLWRREMAPYLEGNWSPFLLGRTARAIFGTLLGWPGWNSIKLVSVDLPGVRSEAAWRAVADDGRGPAWRLEFEERLAVCLKAAAENFQALKGRTEELKEFLEQVVVPAWPEAPAWHFELEIWSTEDEDDEVQVPVLCWAKAGADILPG
jgi:hypothetical protein